MSEKLTFKAGFKIVPEGEEFRILVIIEVGGKKSEIRINNHSFSDRGSASEFISANARKIVKSILSQIGYEMEDGGFMSGAGETYH